MAGKVFAGSWIRSQESRIPLVSSVQVPESKILIQEEQASVRPTSPPVSFWLAAFSLHFSTLSQSLSFRQRSFTRLPYHFPSSFLFGTPSLSESSHIRCLESQIDSLFLTRIALFSISPTKPHAPVHGKRIYVNQEEMIPRRCL